MKDETAKWIKKVLALQSASLEVGHACSFKKEERNCQLYS